MQLIQLSVSLAPTPTCQPSFNLASNANLGQGYYCIRFRSVCLSVSPRIAYLFNMDYLQASNYETSLANYYTFTLDNLRPLSNGHLSMQHLSWRHLSISAISQLLLPWFWQHFKIIKPLQQIITNELPWSNTPGQKGLILNIVTSPSPLLSSHVHPHPSPALSLDNSTNNN